MNYFYDLEFLEGKQDKTFMGIKYGKTPPTIDLISIGIVSDDNREYYAISKDFNLKEAWNRYDIKIEQMYGDMRNTYPEGRKIKVYWIRENVLRPIFEELCFKEYMALTNDVAIDYINIIKETDNPFKFFKTEMLYKFPTNSWEFSYSNIKGLIQRNGKSSKQIAEEIKNFIYE